jgi:hypothetical protein
MLLPVAVQAAPCDVTPELQLTAVDESRLSHLLESREKGIAAALATKTDEATSTVDALFGRELTPVDHVPAGTYQCRTIKLGGPYGAFTAYGFFTCEVMDQGEEQAIQKLGGSQRFLGELIDVDGGLVFKGADHYDDEEPLGYDIDPERNAVGCLSRVSPDAGSYLLEFPMPFLESDHDVIELKPAD